MERVAATGGVVRLEAKRYTIDRPLNVPEGVTLAGVWEAPHHAQLSRGTVFEVRSGKGDEQAPPAVTLRSSSCIKGITFYYPEQRVPDVIAYPWTIQAQGIHCSVIDCTFVNPYKAMDFGTYHGELHYIRNCFGCPLRIGVHVDRCTDIGRIENVHFNPHYWARADAGREVPWEPLRKYLWENLVAFEFARTDWEYVHNTFVFGAKVGYRFFKSASDQRPPGTANGNFLGIGADWCQRALLVEDCQMPGLLITNGEFVGGEGADAMMEVLPSNRGPVNLSNCSFWGPTPQAALLRGRGTTSFSQCNFLNHPAQAAKAFTLVAERGDLIVQACRFGIDSPDIRLEKDVETAVIMGNWFQRSREIENHSDGDVQEAANVVAGKKIQKAP